jgi:putative flippase GtrA
MSLPAALRWLLQSGHGFARLVRFGIVGVLVALVYAAATALLVSRYGVAPLTASLAGYAIALPFSFLGHRGFSFRSQGRAHVEAPRFLVGQAINLTVTVLAMRGATAGLHVSYLWGVAATIVLAPLANFLLMHFWVFGRAKPTSPAAAR